MYVKHMYIIYIISVCTANMYEQNIYISHSPVFHSSTDERSLHSNFFTDSDLQVQASLVSSPAMDGWLLEPLKLKVQWRVPKHSRWHWHHPGRGNIFTTIPDVQIDIYNFRNLICRMFIDN